MNQLTPTETITFVAGIILCVIGVSTFVVGMIQRAKSDGILTNKVDSAVKGIEEIKHTLTEQRDWREDIGITVAEHTQQLNTLFRRVETLEKEQTFQQHKNNNI